MQFFRMKSKIIWDVNMDNFDVSNGRLATAGIGPCFCFLVVLNNGQEVFIEHRSAVFLNTASQNHRVAECFTDVAEHIDMKRPGAIIT